MELSRFTDYSLRTLLFAGVHAGRNVTVPEVAAAYRISENHLVKVAQELRKLGLIDTWRGRKGGFRLARPAEEIRLGEVVRSTETLVLVECLREDGGSCPIDGACVLKGVICEAREAFLAVFDRYTLADLLSGRLGEKLRVVLGGI